MHFVHLRSERADAPALLVMHGWPHTFALQLDFADLLPDFHVVVASLPGFAFSSPYADGPMSERRIAATMHALMTDVLGYERYVTYGEDVTANVSDLIAALHPEQIVGIVATHAHFPTYGERDELTDAAERAFFDDLAARHGTDGAYGHVQATRPDTLAVALNDSPAGLLAWLAEKLVEWSDTPPGDPSAVERRISRDRILTEAMIYWVTQSIGSSFRPYYEGADQPDPIPPTSVPAAVFIQRHEGGVPRVDRAPALPRPARVRPPRRGRALRDRRGARRDGGAGAGVRALARLSARDATVACVAESGSETRSVPRIVGTSVLRYFGTSVLRIVRFRSGQVRARLRGGRASARRRASAYAASLARTPSRGWRRARRGSGARRTPAGRARRASSPRAGRC